MQDGGSALDDGDLKRVFLNALYGHYANRTATTRITLIFIIKLPARLGSSCIIKIIKIIKIILAVLAVLLACVMAILKR